MNESTKIEKEFREEFYKSSNLKLTSKNAKQDRSVIEVNGIRIGSNEFIIMAGPCAVENEEQIMQTARLVKAGGAKILRGGAFKPRTSPYSFRGLGEEGLKLLAGAKKEFGLSIVTEVLDTRHVDLVSQYADILQVGSRNMQCFPLLEEVGLSEKPVLLKRGMSSKIKEFLSAAEYIMKKGNHKVLLCERGIRTFETSTRNTLDLSAVPMLKCLTHLPVIVDPSHSTGLSWMVPTMAKAAVAVNADGLLVEVHHQPEKALSDGTQSLSSELFHKMMEELKPLIAAVGREFLPA